MAVWLSIPALSGALRRWRELSRIDRCGQRQHISWAFGLEGLGLQFSATALLPHQMNRRLISQFPQNLQTFIVMYVAPFTINTMREKQAFIEDVARHSVKARFYGGGDPVAASPRQIAG